jgi:hypothetical protein
LPQPWPPFAKLPFGCFTPSGVHAIVATVGCIVMAIYVFVGMVSYPKPVRAWRRVSGVVLILSRGVGTLQGPTAFSTDVGRSRGNRRSEVALGEVDLFATTAVPSVSTSRIPVYGPLAFVPWNMTRTVSRRTCQYPPKRCAPSSAPAEPITLVNGSSGCNEQRVGRGIGSAKCNGAVSRPGAVETGSSNSAPSPGRESSELPKFCNPPEP